jgi:hypothetical protein
MPQQLTVISLDDAPPRIWTGHIQDDGVEAYLDGLSGVPVGARVRFSHMEVYSDIGQSILNRTFRLDTTGWTEI